MVSVGDRDRQRISGIRASNLCSRKQPLNHRMDLRLFGISDTDDCFLHETRRIFADVDPRARCNHQHDAARLPELQSRLGVLVDEHFLYRRSLRRIVGEYSLKL